MNFADVLSNFARDFDDELHKYANLDPDRASELFNKHFTQLLMNMIRQVLEDDKSRKDAETNSTV